MGEKGAYTGHSSSLFVQRESMGLVGELGPGQGQDTCQLGTAGQALSKSLLKSAVTLCRRGPNWSQPP